ncbi:molybdopterin-dependent oxidoreductase [Thermodesulfobacteriota bacterium]
MDERHGGEYPNSVHVQLRCRAFRHWVYHPDRLKYPMKRTRPKGEGVFERITRDEAIETIAQQLKHVKRTYGNSSIFFHSSGYLGALHRGTAALGGEIARVRFAESFVAFKE